jgi:hypothetical protein
MRPVRLAAAGVAALAGLLAAESSVAQFERSRRSVAADRETLIYSYWNCQTGIISAVNGQAEKGRVTTRQSTQRRCGNRTQPVIEVIYTPAANFRGDDDVYIHSGSGQKRLYLTVK